MPKRSGARRYGNPAKRRPVAGDLGRLVQPTGVSDPRHLGGDMSGPGGSRDRGAVFLDTTDAVLLDSTDVCTVDAVRQGALAEPVIFMVLDGRINKRTDRARVGYLFGPDGAAALITELLALADRFERLEAAVTVDDGLDWPPPTDYERRRREHLDACWNGCDDLHDDPCEYCESTGCLGDCSGEEDDLPTFPTVVTEYAFTERGLL